MGDGPWSPPGEEPESESLRAVRDWVDRGNTLIVVAGTPDGLPWAFRESFVAGRFEEVDVDRRVGPPSPAELEAEDPVEKRPETIVTSPTEYGPLTVEAGGPRWKPAEPKQAEAAAPASDEDTTGWRLAGDGRGGVLYRIPVGRGACYVLLDSFAWTNAGLDAGDNAGVLAGILGREIRGGSLAIDEHRHGHGQAESFLTYLLRLPGASGFLWLALAWCLLYYYARNVRLKPAERHSGQERRTAREYIDAVAQLNERARAAPLAVEAVAGRLRQLAKSSFEHDAAVDAVLREADAYVKAGRRPASPRDAISLVTELVQLRKRLYGSRRIS
jgi:hypothetical protein